MNKIQPAAVRYIKLGKGGRWETASLGKGELHFGHRRVPHDVAQSNDREGIKVFLVEKLGRDPRSSADDAREVADFYHMGKDCLWITFAGDHLWWTFADLPVAWLGRDDMEEGARMRPAIGGWRKTDVNGLPLRTNNISTKLTKVAGYRRTICAVGEEEYLLRLINGVPDSRAAERNQTRETMLAVLTKTMKDLHWKDFETYSDIVFARSGWHRVSALGGTQKLFDMVIEQPTTDERAAVQVKSGATQDTLDKFVAQADETDLYDRLFFVCHSPKGTLNAPADRPDVHVWSEQKLSEIALRLGLADWILERAS